MNYRKENDLKFDLKIKINKGRYNILFMVIMSIINIFLIMGGNGNMLPYSSAISNYSIALGISASEKSGDSTMRILGLVVACAVLMALMLCYVLSKGKPLYLIISLSIIAADTIALIIISIVSGTIGLVYVVLDILIHLLAIVYLVNAIRAFNKLLEMHETEKTVLNTNANNYKRVEYDIISDGEDIIKDTTSEKDDEEDLTKPIRKYEDDGQEHLVEGEFDGFIIFTIIDDDIAKLVINGYVCDELYIAHMNEFELRAIVNDVDYSFVYKRSFKGEAMYLYADDTLLDSLGIN